MAVETEAVNRQSIGSKNAKNVTEEERLVAVSEVQGTFGAFGFDLNNRPSCFVKPIGKPEVLQLDLTADKLFIKLRKRSVKALQEFKRR